ncbi:MAG: hypothetical protein IJP09_01780, partial [Clostridia bacterium]|nr:hypothetical protein [Clostridia bacterium]
MGEGLRERGFFSREKFILEANIVKPRFYYVYKTFRILPQSAYAASSLPEGAIIDLPPGGRGTAISGGRSLR